MSYARVFISFAGFKTRAEAIASVSETSALGTWRDVGVRAVDDRVVWTLEDDGIWLRFREEAA